MKILLFLFSILSLQVKAWYELDQIKPQVAKHPITLNGKKIDIASYTYSYHKSAPLVTTVHGYLVNCHYLLPIHQFLYQNGFNIICFELPGLGQSGGARARISNFKDYQVFMNAIKEIAPDSPYLITHSTGAVGHLQNLFENKTLPYRHTIMITPLVRNYRYWWTKWAYAIGRFFISSVSRDQKRIFPSDQLTWMHQNDPFFYPKTPLSWVGQLIKWNTAIEKKSQINEISNLTLLYAGEDQVVDSVYNEAFLKVKLPKAEHLLYPEGSHYLFYQTGIKEKVFDLIKSRFQRIESLNN